MSSGGPPRGAQCIMAATQSEMRTRQYPFASLRIHHPISLPSSRSLPGSTKYSHRLSMSETELSLTSALASALAFALAFSAFALVSALASASTSAVASDTHAFGGLWPGSPLPSGNLGPGSYLCTGTQVSSFSACFFHWKMHTRILLKVDELLSLFARCCHTCFCGHRMKTDFAMLQHILHTISPTLVGIIGGCTVLIRGNSPLSILKPSARRSDDLFDSVFFLGLLTVSSAPEIAWVDNRGSPMSVS
mmetsp:Transcript_133425/g.266208  ORF Transcript_133425/g.266208 Transcript_133425/m.266208 type:complete len:248 (+) Transcript_133425:354-1097(+)